MDALNDCRRCPRLTRYRRAQKAQYPDYHCRPVASFGDTDARLLIVGLAPGLHGANASGRPFTGDASGDFLFDALYRHGYASHPVSRSRGDGLQLSNCRITNAVRCVPPKNRPNAAEIERCNTYLRPEIHSLGPGSILLALGRLAHDSILRALEIPRTKLRFAHLAEHPLPRGLWLVDSYHCSRYNLNTRRLDRRMFDLVFERIARRLQ